MSHSSSTQHEPTQIPVAANDKAVDIANDPSQQSVPINLFARLEHFTWAWFCFPMSTGGLALLLSTAVQPHSFPGLNTIGKTVYVFDIVIFILSTLAITYRFTRYRGTLRASLTHPTESLFAATFLLSLASIIASMARHGISTIGIENAGWLITTYRVLFWTYYAVTLIWAVFAYTILFTSPLLKIEDMTPAWDLPIFPFMLCGTIASTGAQYQSPDQAVPMIIAGLTAQGLGFIVSVIMYASYVRRMVQFGFPHATARPAMFIAVGPPSFTALAILGMSSAWPKAYINYFGDDIHNQGATGILDTEQQQMITVQILQVLATMSAVFIWSLSLWFFAIGVVACLQGAGQMEFHLNWWAFVFPNTGLTIATISIGKVLQSQGIMWVGSLMSIGIVATWLFVLVNHAWALWNRKILWPGQDENLYSPSFKRAEEGSKSDVEKQD